MDQRRTTKASATIRRARWPRTFWARWISRRRATPASRKGLDEDLRGKPGSTRLLTDVHRRGIDSQETTPAKPGASITLTIDERLQFVAEREIATAVGLHHADSGSIVVMNPYNGDILAMASYPTFDPNLPLERGQDPKPRMNHAISVPFEPGSVYKVVTLSAALETTNLRPESPINCNGGKITFGSRTIHDSHGGIWAWSRWRRCWRNPATSARFRLACG